MLSLFEVLGMEVKDAALQLTAYERFGSVGVDDLKELVFNEIKDNEIDLNSYNEWLLENNYYDDEIFYNDEDFFNTFFYNNPMEAARATFYGDYRFSDEFVRFNAYGNLDSADYLDDLMDMREDYWSSWIDENIDFEDEESQEVVDLCNDLVKQGY